MTFTQFLKTKKHEDTPVGDFARDWFFRDGMPKPPSPEAFDGLKRWLKRNYNPDPSALRAAEETHKQARQANEQIATIDRRKVPRLMTSTSNCPGCG